jgi:general stress protein YciG
MAGTKDGGKAAAKTNKEKYGSDFYARIGAAGGKKGRTGGFFANRELAREAGRKGGRISRRTKKTDVAEAKSTSQQDVELAA